MGGRFESDLIGGEQVRLRERFQSGPRPADRETGQHLPPGGEDTHLDRAFVDIQTDVPYHAFVLERSAGAVGRTQWPALWGKAAPLSASSRLNRVGRKGGQIRQRAHGPYVQSAGPGGAAPAPADSVISSEGPADRSVSHAR